MAQKVKLQFNFTKRPFDQPIHYKSDGGRFEVEKTVKLNINSKYTIDITMRPPREIEQFTLQGGEVAVTLKERDMEAAVYKAEWLTTGLEKCKKGARSKLDVMMQIRGVGKFDKSLQVKLYSASEMQHSHWGTVLNVLEFDCQSKEGQESVDIVQETFR